MAKNKRVVVCVLLFVYALGSAFSYPEISTVIDSQVGVQEQPRGSNWGGMVTVYLRHAHVNFPAAWCAAFVHYCLDSAGIPNNVNAYAPTAQNAKHLIYSGGHFKEDPKCGDVFTVYFISMKRIAHCGFWHARHNGSSFETIEGNSNTDGSRDGYEVCKRIRSYHTVYSVSRWGS